MKKITLLLTLLLTIFQTTIQAQEVSLNEQSNLYEYSNVSEYEKGKAEKIDQFSNKMKELNYSNINSTDSDVKGENFFSKLILGSAMEIHYNSLILFKEDKYKLILNNFRIKDVRYGTMPLEGLRKKSLEKWVELINEKLPEIVSNLESSTDW